VVLVVFIVQCVAVGLWFTMKSKVEDEVRSKMSDLLKNYEGVSSTSEKSKGWDLLFLGFDCCGVDDIVSLTSNPDEFNLSAWWTARTDTTIKVPGSCCTGATEETYKTYAEDACTKTLTTHQKKGCYEAFKDWIKKYETAAIAIGIVLIVIEIIAVVFAFVVCRAISKDEMVV